MPKFPKPFFRTARNAWFVQVAGKQVNLGPDQDAAFRSYHKLMGRPKADPPPIRTDTVLAVLDAFLDWCQKNKASRTYDWYRDYLESFARTMPAGLTIGHSETLSGIVQQWLDANPAWKTGKRGAVIAVQRAFNWAVRMGIIAASPIRGVEKPAAGRREHVIDDAGFNLIISLVRDPEFRDLLTACWNTGCRPQEALAVEARHVDLTAGTWAFPVNEAKGKKYKRIVYLADTALAITGWLMASRPRGRLFVNTDGRPWSASSALNCRFGRLRVALGRTVLAESGLMPPKLRSADPGAAQRPIDPAGPPGVGGRAAPRNLPACPAASSALFASTPSGIPGARTPWNAASTPSPSPS